MDIELNNLILHIFSKPPQSPKSYSINFQVDNVEELFETLLIILSEAIKILYSDNNTIDITNLTIEDINKLKEYYLSFGIQLNILINRLDQSFISNSNIKEKLSDYYFSLKSNKNSNYYIITFDIL